MIWIFWEMTSGTISVCSALRSTVDTCFCQSTRLWGVSHIFNVNANSDPTGAVVQTVQNSVEFPQLQFGEQVAISLICWFAVAVHRQICGFFRTPSAWM